MATPLSVEDFLQQLSPVTWTPGMADDRKPVSQSLYARSDLPDSRYDAVVGRLHACLSAWGGTRHSGGIGHHRYDGTGEKSTWEPHQSVSWRFPFNGQQFQLAIELQVETQAGRRRFTVTGIRTEPRSSVAHNAYRITWHYYPDGSQASSVKPQQLARYPDIARRCGDLGLAVRGAFIAMPAGSSPGLIPTLLMVLTIIEDAKARRPMTTPMDHAALLAQYRHQAIVPDESGAVQAKYGAGGEGQEHRVLKEHVFAHPEALGFGPVATILCEYSFITGNRVDLLAFLPDGRELVIEVETDIALPGVHQALMYRTLRITAVGAATDAPHIIPVLVAHQVDGAAQACAEQYGVRIVVVPRTAVGNGS